MNVGIICDLVFDKHIGIKNYFYAIKNIFNNIKIINNLHDLENIDMLFIGNEHFLPHRNVWENELFQKMCNYNNIKVVVFSCERIYNSSFLHNVKIQENLKKFDNLYQYCIDADDIEILNCKPMKSCISKEFKNIILSEEKQNKCAFLGNVDCFSYNNRKKLLEDVGKHVEIVFPQKKEKWCDYIHELSKYRFIISPLGNANSFNLKFYEILLAKSIPIQQVKNNTLKYYQEESMFRDCIYFEDVDEIKNKINNCTLQNSTNSIWLEDYIVSLLRNDLLLKD